MSDQATSSEVEPKIESKAVSSASPSEENAANAGTDQVLTEEEKKHISDQLEIRTASKGSTENLERGGWDNRMEFILASLGNVVGIGNVWRFPFLAYKNGGAVFVFCYIILLFLIGLPMLLLETYLGQFTQMGAINAFSHLSPMFVGMGYCTLLTAWVIGAYYNMIIAWTIYYMGDILAQRWGNCSFYPNDRCATVDVIKNYTNYSLPSDLYFNYWALNKSPTIMEWSGPQLGLTIALAVTTAMVILALLQGTSTSGKVVYVTATFPYIFFAILIVVGLTLEGSGEGIKYYLLPDMSKILNPVVWKEAVVQSFYSVGVGIGVMITFGSYNKFHNPMVRDVMIIIFGDFFTCFIAGFIVFAMIGNVAHLTNKPVNQTVDAGPGLAFVVIIAGLTQLRWPVVFVGAFLVMLFLLGIDSQFSYVEHLITWVSDRMLDNKRKPNKPLIAMATGVSFFLPGLLYTTQQGIHVYNLVSSFTSGIPVLFVAGVECMLLGVVYGMDNVIDDVGYMTGYKANKVIRFVMKILAYVIPILMFLLLGLDLYDRYMESKAERLIGFYEYFPWWSFILGWTLAVLPVLCIPIGMVVYIRNSNLPFRQAIVQGLKPTPRFKYLSKLHGNYEAHLVAQKLKKEAKKAEAERKRSLRSLKSRTSLKSKSKVAVK